MSLSLYDITVPVFIRALGNLSAIVEKGRAFADEKGIAHSELLEARLFSDMAPFTSQIQRVSDGTRLAAVRLGGVENVAMPDTEATFDELQARIARTVEFLKAVPANSMDGREDAEVVLKTPDTSLTFTGRSYVLNFALPNIFFHVTTAYDILRHKGVPLGKRDYIGEA